MRLTLRQPVRQLSSESNAMCVSSMLHVLVRQVDRLILEERNIRKPFRNTIIRIISPCVLPRSIIRLTWYSGKCISYCENRNQKVKAWDHLINRAFKLLTPYSLLVNLTQRRSSKRLISTGTQKGPIQGEYK